MSKISSLYIHFPFCKHLCNYCDFYKNKLDDDNQVRGFEKLLSQQWESHLDFLDKNSFKLVPMETIYIGGGTPSLWGVHGARFFEDFLKQNKIKIQDDCEFTIEIDPDIFDPNTILEWNRIGVNRFSVGAQAFDNDLLVIMDRQHNVEHIVETVRFLSSNKFNYSVDLMLGLPDSSSRNILNEIDELLKFSPDHFSVYILKTRKNYPHNSRLPEDEQVRSEYLAVSKYLISKGYEHYEISNFTKEKKYSKHNIKYWDYQSVGAIGPNATGLLVERESAIRYQWKSMSSGYQTENIDGESLIIEKLFLGLRHQFGFDINKLFTPDNHKALDDIYNSWSKLGYLKESSKRERISLNALGYLMCDSLIDDVFKKIKF